MSPRLWYCEEKEEYKMLRIKANYEQERRSIVSALVESGYKVRLEYEFIRPQQPTENEFSKFIPSFMQEPLEPVKNVYIIVEEVPEDELCKIIG
jgi:hypothetical protein